MKVVAIVEDSREAATVIAVVFPTQNSTLYPQKMHKTQPGVSEVANRDNSPSQTVW